MSHSSGSTHHTTPSNPTAGHSTASHPSTGHSYKNTIQQFTDAVNGNHLNNLEKYLENNVQKSLDSQVVYKDLKEAHDYYDKEHTNNKTAQWKVLNYHDDDQKSHTIKAKVTYNDKTYNTTYTFSSSGKIQSIEATLENNQHQTTPNASN